MSERYVDEDLERRLLNWQRWKLGDSGNPLGYVVSRFEFVDTSGYREASIPIMAGEAREVNDAVATIPVRYRIAIIQEYLWPEKSQQSKAAFMGISVRTFYRNVDHGKLAISEYLRELRRKVRAANRLTNPPN